MMSRRSTQELLEAVRRRYKRAGEAEKVQILDELVANTGYHRNSAIRALNHPQRVRNAHKAGRKKEYQGEALAALARIWYIEGRICSRRLHPFLPEIVPFLERIGALCLSAEGRQQLLEMSRATIDRSLQRERKKAPPKGHSTTKPGSLLKSSIPIKLYTPWDEQKPGFVEIDLVAHCGPSVEGVFLYTLTATDIATGWTECFGLANRTHADVMAVMPELRQRLPFPLLGIDSDNGGEFINEALLRYCRQEKIDFTRCRPYHKNDQAHVEQKNWSIVRQTVGYSRMTTQEELARLRSIYADLRLYTNYFQPVLKLVDKPQVDGRTKRVYDVAMTPYRRVLKLVPLPIEAKARLAEVYISLNPVQLRETLDAKVDELYQFSR